MMWVAMYLMTIVAANLLVTQFGQAALPFTALVLIPFDLTARDILHERWNYNKKKLYTSMGLLILAGAIITYILNRDAINIAIASTVAFSLAAATDTLVYEACRGRSKRFKMNASNLMSSMVDSVVFPLVAFGTINPFLTWSQAVMKIVGGALWVTILLMIKRSYTYGASRRSRSSEGAGRRNGQSDAPEVHSPG